MEVLPSEYNSLNLSRYEKMFIRYTLSNNEYGFLLMQVNPAMQLNNNMDVVILPQGIVMCKFFDNFNDASQFPETMNAYISYVYPSTRDLIEKKLLSNKSLCDNFGKIKFPVAIVNVFPNLKKPDVYSQSLSMSLKTFSENNCIFFEDFSKLRADYFFILQRYLENPITPVSKEEFVINDSNVNSIFQRIAPEYITIRVAEIKDTVTSAGAASELLVVDENDIAVRAFRLDQEQINIVNKISKGDQLILACAGSGKSVLLISKCFKAARMNPDKKFLITCYNENLKSLYTWFIDRAGLREKNVICLTFHSLCRNLLKNNGFYINSNDFDGWVNSAIDKLNQGKIKERFYGIFIDEVQIFKTEWYKLCFNLLENKSSEDHLFVICGDKTQNLEKQKKHGTAPWQAGEGYPNYRGGNKNIRIERNYRNCIEINEFINRYVTNAKKYLHSIESDYDIDPDSFLRGQAVSHGTGVELRELTDHCNFGEADEIIRSIQDIHDVHEIPYDEIAVVMYNSKFKSKFPHWKDKAYSLEYPLIVRLKENDMPFCLLYSNKDEWQDHYGETGGIRLIKFQSALGLDFRAVIVCGIKPLGYHEKIKTPDWNELKKDEEKYLDAIQETYKCIRNLYVALTRAKEILHIIVPESEEDSVFIKLLKESI